MLNKQFKRLLADVASTMLDVGHVLAGPKRFLELDAIGVAFQGSLRALQGVVPPTLLTSQGTSSLYHKQTWKDQSAASLGSCKDA